MRSTRSLDTGPELALRKELWRLGLRGYRVNLLSLPGTPDVVFTKQKLAIFVHDEPAHPTIRQHGSWISLGSWRSHDRIRNSR